MKTGGFSAVNPVDDIHDSSHAYDKQECDLRRKLATLYRLVHHLGWSQAIYNHITVRPSYVICCPFVCLSAVCMHVCMHACMYYPGQKNRYSRDIHEIDPQCDHGISIVIDCNLQRELTMCRCRGSRRRRTDARYHTISHDRTADQPHEFLGCNDFFGQDSMYACMQ